MNHTEEIIKASLVVSNLLGVMMDVYEHNTENGEELYEAMDALWYAIEAYKVSTTHERLATESLQNAGGR
jgi:hypothetical protein